MYPSQPGETSEYVTSEEPSSFVDGESPRVEYNHLVGGSLLVAVGPLVFVCRYLREMYWPLLSGN